MHNEFLDSAITAALRAGAHVKKNMGLQRVIQHKGEIDLVTDIDRQNEEMIFTFLQSAHPEIGFMSEEGTMSESRQAGMWIVDPLDGTTNFAHGYPHAAISIALNLEGETELGVVYNPFLDELFHARRGKGAFLNRARVHVSTVERVDAALLATGFPYSIRKDPHLPLALLNSIVLRCQGIRREGVASLDLCYAASGRVDGFWEVGLKIWDVAAGNIMVREAGGTVTDFDGRPHMLDSPYTCASNGKIHQELLELIQLSRKEVAEK